MNKYTIYCTEEQTKKAFELGAQINVRCSYNGYHPLPFNKEIIIEPHHFAEVPTAEQMIGWLESQDGIEEITVCKTGMWIWGKNHTLIDGSPNYSSRQESSLAAIDAALDYLAKEK